MTIRDTEFCRVRIRRNLKDPLKSIASARHITCADLTSQVLSRFISARRALLSENAENYNEQETKA